MPLLFGVSQVVWSIGEPAVHFKNIGAKKKSQTLRETLTMVEPREKHKASGVSTDSTMWFNLWI